MKEKEILEVFKKNKIKRPILKNTIKAFIVGGAIGLFSESLSVIYFELLKLKKHDANLLALVTLIVLAIILTGFGIYDKLGQFSGAGTIVPITGFANSMSSSAIESKTEGVVLGVLTNMFKLAGAVIVAGVVAAFISGNIYYLLEVVWAK